MSELSKLEYFFSNLNYEHLFAIEGKKLTEEQAKEIVHRCNCHDELVVACDKANWLLGTMIKEGMLNADSDIKKMLEAALAKAQNGN